MGRTDDELSMVVLLLRLLYPVLLISCSVVRPSLFSFVYLLFFFYIPFSNLSAWTLKLLLVLSGIFTLSQFTFQIVLLSVDNKFLNYSLIGSDCPIDLQRLFSFIGLTNLQSQNYINILRTILPDLTCLIVTLITLYVFKKVQKTVKLSRIKKLYKSISPYLILSILLINSALEPSLVSISYYLLFLIGCTCWALNLSSKIFYNVLFSFAAIIVFVHSSCLYFYQIGEIRIFTTLPINRLIGLVDYLEFSPNCTTTTTTLTTTTNEVLLNMSLPLSTWLSPLSLLVSFHLIVYHLFTKVPVQEIPSQRRGSVFTSSLRRKYTFKRKKSNKSGKNEQIPLVVDQQQEGNYGTLSEEDNHNNRLRTLSNTSSSVLEGRYWVIVSTLLSTFDLFIKSSYIGTNIIMMAWSITYHSWLTFILLLWACLLWMFPNQRRAVLISSPILVLYAELLLLIQFVYSLDYPFPEQINNINLKEIGLQNCFGNSFTPILVKSVYTLMFWITLRQYVMQKRSSLIENAAQESFRITISSYSGGAIQTEEKDKKSWLKKLLIKLWIWVVAMMLFVIGLGGGDKVVVYRIVYMALFLVFILSFQLSYNCWRKMLYSFWLTVICYSILVLVLIYTYQFEDIPQYLTNYTGIPFQLQKDIGLEKFDTGDLFVRLLTPTFFLIITVIQLHYFHQDYISEKKQYQPDKIIITDESEPERNSLKFWINLVYKKVLKFYEISMEIFMRLLEIHIVKIVLFSCFILTVFDKSLLHLFLCLLCVISVILSLPVLLHMCSIYISILFLLKMIYQIDYISHSYWDNDCDNSTATFSSTRLNDAEWLGLVKIGEHSSLASLLAGYIGMIGILTLQAVIKIRGQLRNQTVTVLFDNIKRSDADQGFLLMIKFLANQAFFKFGVEATLVTLVLVVGTRLDVFSVLYSFWLIPMFRMKRKQLYRIWLPFITFIAVLLPVQYLSSVGLPPFLCIDYPWSSWDVELKAWLFLPDFYIPPDISRLLPDFLLLLISCSQLRVFRAEQDNENDEIMDNSVSSNPTPDFLSTNSNLLDSPQNYLNTFKKCIFLSFYWITLGIIFLTGTNRVNLFALGYLVGSFIFLWEGNEFYLREKIDIVKRWNYLLAYNVFVICIKSLLQLVGCVFLSSLQYQFCWLIQLLGIACLNKFKGQSSEEINRVLLDPMYCEVPHDEAGLVWDGITFIFLLLQRRIFFSYYFFHIRAETEVQARLASRGAELIEELMQEQIKQQELIEKDVLEKIKMKMDRIKATHDKQRDHIDNHFDEDSSMISSPISLIPDEDKTKQVLAPLATLTMTPTPMSSSAAVTLSVDGFFEQSDEQITKSHEYDYYFYDEVEEEKIEDEHDDVFEDKKVFLRKKRNMTRSHHTSIRSGDYYMFQEEEDDDEIGMIDEEEDEDKSKKRLSSGVTLSELMSSALKTGELSSDKVKRKSLVLPEDISHEDEDITADEEDSFMKKLLSYLRFGWAIIESMQVSLTCWMNKFSKDYRTVSIALAKEKVALKATQKTEPAEVVQDEEELEEVSSSFEGSKDDLQTVIEMKSDRSQFSSETSESSLQKLIELIVSVWYVIISHSDLVCYFIVFLNQIKSSSILSLPLPLMVLLWGSLSVPRPTKTFWVTIIAYTEAMVVLKYLFQFDFFPWNGKANQGKKDPFWPPKILGIEKQEKYAVYDVVLLMAVFFHRFMLKSLGLWKNANNSSKSIVEEIEQSKSSADNLIDANNWWEGWRKVDSFFGPSYIKICFSKYISSIRQFFKQILKKDFRVKVDVYSYMFMCDFFNFLVVIFGFASFGSQDGDVSRYLEENKVPVPFLVMVIVQFALIVIDRALYLRKDIRGKFFFQITLASFVHVAMFFLLPYVTERDFNANTPPQMWYMVKCIYLLLSAYQIRSGYPTRILGNFLCKKYNYLNMFLFKGFMGVPFLFELRALMDWIWTDTSMTLSDWLKLEDIFAHIFQLKCQRRVEKEYPQGRGLPKPPLSKYSIGGCSLFMIIAIIWFPLVLFALGNTVGIPNKPLDISLEITLGSYQPIYTMSAQKSSLGQFSQSDWNSLEYIYRRDKSGQNFLSNYEYEDVWMAKLNGNSSGVWGISPPSKEKLVEELVNQNPLGVRVTWTITRDTTNPTVQAIARGKGDEIELTKENRLLLIQMINSTSSSQIMKINGIFPKFLRVSNSGKAEVTLSLNQALLDDRHWRYNKMIVADKSTQNAVLRNLTLKLERKGPEEWWVVEEDCNDVEKSHDLPLSDKCGHLNLYTFNEKAFPPTLSFISGGGIIGLYTTLVLVASKFVRSFFSGISFLIMFDDMPNVDRIFQLCLDIYLVRESGELALEEDLFAKLIFLYRSPETLIRWTRVKSNKVNTVE